MPPATVRELMRPGDSVELSPYWTPLCQLLTLLPVFIMKKKIITASSDGGPRNGKLREPRGRAAPRMHPEEYSSFPV